MRFTSSLSLCLLLLACAGDAGPSGPVSAISADLRVFVVVIDGLGPGRVRPALMPELCRIAHCPGTPQPDPASHATIYAEARAAMVAQTNPNHVAMMTGAYGEVSGAVANSFYNRRAKREEVLDRSALILTPTLFDVLEGVRETAVVAGKEKLRWLFDCTREGGSCAASSDNPEGVSVRHAAPDFLKGAAQRVAAGSDDCQAIPSVSRGVAVDACIMDLAVDLSSREDPAFMLINLARTDQAQHNFGPGSAVVDATIAAADLEIGHLVAYLKSAGKWERTVLFVLSDHSFSDLRQATGHGIDLGAIFREDRRRNPAAWGARGGIGEAFAVIPGGGVAQVSLASVSASAEGWTPAQADALARMRHLALFSAEGVPRAGISEALYRLPGSRDSGNGIDAVHPGWHLRSARTGDLFVTALASGPSGAAQGGNAYEIARGPGFAFVNPEETGPPRRGHHGNPGARHIPFVIASGGRFVVDQIIEAALPDAVNEGDDTRALPGQAETVDVAPTILWLFGLLPEGAVDAREILPGAGGRVLKEAFAQGRVPGDGRLVSGAPLFWPR